MKLDAGQKKIAKRVAGGVVLAGGLGAAALHPAMRAFAGRKARRAVRRSAVFMAKVGNPARQPASVRRVGNALKAFEAQAGKHQAGSDLDLAVRLGHQKLRQMVAEKGGLRRRSVGTSYRASTVVKRALGEAIDDLSRIRRRAA